MEQFSTDEIYRDIARNTGIIMHYNLCYWINVEMGEVKHLIGAILKDDLLISSIKVDR